MKSEKLVIFSFLPNKFLHLDKDLKNEILYQIKYQGYLDREIKNIAKLKQSEKIKIPVDFSYNNLPGLRNESAEKLSLIKPETLAQASRISGVKLSDISVLMIFYPNRMDNFLKKYTDAQSREGRVVKFFSNVDLSKKLLETNNLIDLEIDAAMDIGLIHIQTVTNT